MKLQSPATAELFSKVVPHELDRMALLYKDDNAFTAKVFSVREGEDKKYEPISWSLGKWITDTLPEAKQLVGKKNRHTYEIAATDNNVEIIYEAWSECRNQLIMDPGARARFIEILANGRLQDQNIKHIARFRNQGVLPTACGLVKEHPRFPLSDYQKVARHCLMSNPGFFLYGDPGTGKTAPTISMICEEAKKKHAEGSNSVYRAVIIVPNNIRFNWENEFKRFATVKGTVTVLYGERNDREAQILRAIASKKSTENLFSIVICSYDSLIATTDALALENILTKEISPELNWDCAVLDESHWIKTPTAARTKASFRVRDRADKRVILTGTPLTNNLFDLWSQFEFLGHGFSGFITFGGFKNFYGQFRLDHITGRKELTEFKNVPLLQERLARLSFRMTKELDLPSLPEKVFDSIECSMTPEQAKKYAQVASEISIEISNQIERDAEAGISQKMTISNILVKMLRLAQVTSGFMKFDDVKDIDGELIEKGRVEHFTPNPKIDALVDLLKSEDKTKDDKTIVWAIDVPAIKKISERLEKEGINHVVFYGDTPKDQRQALVDRFNNDPECTVFVGNPMAGGIGLNLIGYNPEYPDKYTSDTTHIIHYSQNWRSDLRSQADDRGHRRGTRKPVRITNLVVPRTIDEEIRERVEDKQASAQNLSDIRGILQRILDTKLETLERN